MTPQSQAPHYRIAGNLGGEVASETFERIGETGKAWAELTQ